MSSRLNAILKVGCLAGMAASVAYYAVSLRATARFFAARGPEPGPDRGGTEAWPGISVLKPVKGVDDEAYANFASFCNQDYPADAYQIIFGVARADDPVVPLIHRLQREFPHLDIQLVIADRVRGPNGKVNSLVPMVAQARFDLLVISDGDIRVGTDYLRQVAAPFSEPRVGLVTCPYRASEPRDLGAALLALGINTTYVPSFLMAAQRNGPSFALGATMAVRKEALAAIGGFEPLAPYLADDFLLGNRVLQAGYRLALAPYLVDHVVPRLPLRDYLDLQLRWARSRRVASPAGYIASVVTLGPVHALAYLLLDRGSRRARLLLGAVVGARLFTGAAIGRHYLRAPLSARLLALLPLRDLAAAGFWAAAFASNRVRWRGRTYRLEQDGTLVEARRSGTAS